MLDAVNPACPVPTQRSTRGRADRRASRCKDWKQYCPGGAEARVGDAARAEERVPVRDGLLVDDVALRVAANVTPNGTNMEVGETNIRDSRGITRRICGQGHVKPQGRQIVKRYLLGCVGRVRSQIAHSPRCQCGGSARA